MGFFGFFWVSFLMPTLVKGMIGQLSLKTCRLFVFVIWLLFEWFVTLQGMCITPITRLLWRNGLTRVPASERQCLRSFPSAGSDRSVRTTRSQNLGFSIGVNGFKNGVRSPKFIWAPVYSCTHWLRPASPPPHFGSYTRSLLVNQIYDIYRTFVTPCVFVKGRCRQMDILLKACDVGTVPTSFFIQCGMYSGENWPVREERIRRGVSSLSVF